MEQQGCFDSLPTEALFSLFRSLDPLSLGPFSTVCKKWDRLSKDNELWRQYCLERWDKNPKESDCVKNWLIPVREGGGTKENRIDWKRCYLIRSQFDSATKFDFLQYFPQKKQRLGFLKKKNAKSSESSNDLFAKGWPSGEDVGKFEKRIESALEAFFEVVTNNENPNGLSIHDIDYLALLDLFFELELSILRQINISRVKCLGSAGQLLYYLIPMLKDFPREVPSRLTQFAADYTKLASEKDLPKEVIAGCLEKVAVAFIDMIRNVVLPPESYLSLVHFVSAVISSSMKPMQDELKQWANQQEDVRPTSPTVCFERILHLISNALVNKSNAGMRIFSKAINIALGDVIETKEQIAVMLSVISAISLGCKKDIMENLEEFMKRSILPYWKPVLDAEYLTPLLYFVSQLLSVSENTIQCKYSSQLIPSLLEMAKNENHNVQHEVAWFVISYCERLDEQSALEPYLADLLEVMYSYFKCSYSFVRKDAILAVSSLIITCDQSFATHKDRMVTEFKKLLTTGNTSDRNSVIEALTRIGASIGEQKSSIEDDIAVLYDQVVEDCKQDRDAHLDLLLKMTEVAIPVLGPKFSKHMSFVFPLIVENARIPTFEVEDVDNQMEDDEDLPEGNKKVTSTISRKPAAFEALLVMIEVVDRETFLSVHEEIEATARHIITQLDQNIFEHVQKANNVYSEYIAKLFVPDDSEWCTTERMTEYWRNASAMFVEGLENTDVMQAKVSFILHLTQIFKHFCQVANPSQPFLTTEFMQHFTEETFRSVWEQYYLAESNGIPFDETVNLGVEIMDLLDEVCINRTDKEMFWDFADPVLESIAAIFEHGVQDYRWFDAGLIHTIFCHFGYEFMTEDRIEYLHLLASCKEIETDDMYRMLANHLGIMARKYPRLLPRDKGINHLLNYAVGLLIGDNCQRASAPAAYDNALMATSGLVLYLISLKEETTGQDDYVWIDKQITTYLTALTNALPPTENGDEEEALFCIDQYCQILEKAQFYFEGEDGAQLKKSVIGALKETLELPAYDTEEVHKLVDPSLEKLQAQ